jgi:hypothetical protein
VRAYAARRALQPASSAGYGSLMSANCARPRITSAAFRSACRVNPHAIQAKRLLRRLSAAIVRHWLHSCDEYLASTSTTRRTALSAFSPIKRRRIPKPASSIARFKPRFAATLRPGCSTVPFAERVIPRRFSFSVTITSALSTIRRAALCSASSRAFASRSFARAKRSSAAARLGLRAFNARPWRL